MEIQFTCAIDRSLYLGMCWLHNLPGWRWIIARGVVMLATFGFIAASLLAKTVEMGIGMAAGMVILIAAEPF